MPYIDPDTKAWLSGYRIVENYPRSAGELNFCFTDLIIHYMGENYGYQKINDVIGALEGAKLEFYRRVAVPYENQKIETNGDVY